MFQVEMKIEKESKKCSLWAKFNVMRNTKIFNFIERIKFLIHFCKISSHWTTQSCHFEQTKGFKSEQIKIWKMKREKSKSGIQRMGQILKCPGLSSWPFSLCCPSTLTELMEKEKVFFFVSLFSTELPMNGMKIVDQKNIAE